MTNKNLSMSINTPFLLKPAGKDYLWGGNRLNDDFAKNIDMKPLAESWECSCHEAGLSMIASGIFKGVTLKDYILKNPEALGTHPKDMFPILVKFIDAKKDLSVQVHPNDEYALKKENSLGKTEMWYVLDASKDATLVYGFSHDMNKEKVKKGLETNTIEKYLQKVKIKKGDVFFIEPGVVHAVCAGALIAEIQESSNITYRLYDYDRIDKNGKKRELHIEKALEVLNYNSSKEPRQPMRVLKHKSGFTTELLCRCQYFQVEKMMIDTCTCRKMACFQSGSSSFEVLLCVDGCGTMFWNDEIMNFYKGDCIFVPANSVEIKIHGQTEILRIGC